MAGSNELCGLTVITEICKKEHIRGNAEILKQLLSEFCETPITNLIENADITPLGGGQFEISVIDDPREGYIAITEDLTFYEFDGSVWVLKFAGLGDFIASATDNGDDTYTFTSFDGNTSVTIAIPLLSVEPGTGIEVDVTDPKRPKVGLDQAMQDTIGSAIQPGDDISELNNDAGYIPDSEKGAFGGITPLDSSGKVPVEYLTNSLMTLEGDWDASSNTPTLADGVGTAGQTYQVTTAGTQDLGSGSLTFAEGDFVVYGNDGKWYKSASAFAPASALMPGDNISELVNDAEFIDAEYVESQKYEDSSYVEYPKNKLTFTEGELDEFGQIAVNSGMMVSGFIKMYKGDSIQFDLRIWYGMKVWQMIAAYESDDESTFTEIIYPYNKLISNPNRTGVRTVDINQDCYIRFQTHTISVSNSDFVFDIKRRQQIAKYTDLVREISPVNYFPKEGYMKNFAQADDVPISGTGYVFSAGNSSAIRLSISPTLDNTKTRYFTIVSADNIVGSPDIGWRLSPSAVAYSKLVVGKVYEIPPNATQFYIRHNGGSVNLIQLYLGYTPYWGKMSPLPRRVLYNYFPNQELNGFPEMIEDAYGDRYLRVYGEGAGVEKTITVEFDKIDDLDFCSMCYRASSNMVVEGRTEFESGQYVLISQNNVHANTTYILARYFDADYSKVILRVSFEGSTSEYLEVFNPAITKEYRILDDVLVDKSEKYSPTGIQTFDSLTDALTSNPPHVFQVGMNLLTRKISHPVLKSDFSLVGSNTEPKKVSKLEKIRYVDLGDWQLKLITSDKKFIFANVGDIRYTYDIEECLVSDTHPTEDRYTFDHTKLTNMFTIPGTAISIRELGDGELVIQRHGTSHYYTTDNQTVLNESGTHPATVGSRIDGWAFDAFGDTVVFSTYEPAPSRGDGSVILSTDGGKMYDEVFNIIDDAPTFFPEVPLNSIHLHGCFIDPYREDIYLIVGDYSFTETTPGKIFVLENYKSNTEWQILPHNFKDGPREQYCTGIALEKNILFGTDMNETCISRMNIGEAGYNSTREWADRLHMGLDYVPNFTRPVEPGAPIGVHYSCTGGSNPLAPLSQIVLTKDGFNFANIYMDTFEKRGFHNNNARVWCTVDGKVYCTQFSGRFPNELIMGRYNGFNMV